ncbi:MAG: Mur ligase family protein, partial [Pseudomonadota bacterium]
MMTAATTENPTLLDDLLAGMTDKAVITGIEVSGLALDSRNVWPGCVFFALAGSRGHGMAFARDAISKGAAAVLYDSTDEGDDLAASMVGIDGPPFVPVRELGRKVGLIADRFFHSPSSRLDIIGITGTNAKTSVSHALAQVLSENNPCAVIGTLGWGFRDNMQDTWHTTPDAVTLHSILAELERLGAKAVAMEVSSHGLDQGRTQGVRFRAAVFTNITRDHLDYHGTMEAYVEAKLRLLR